MRALVDAANAAGGEDNITAVALRLEAEDGQRRDGRRAETGEVIDERPTATLEAVVPPVAAEPAPRPVPSPRRSRLDATAVALAVPAPPAEPEAPRDRAAPDAPGARAAARRTARP